MNWKDSKTNIQTPINQMSDEQIQEALHTVQKRQYHSLIKLKKSAELEKALNMEAKRRKQTLVSLELADNPSYSNQFKGVKEIINTVNKSITRKEKSLNVSSKV